MDMDYKLKNIEIIIELLKRNDICQIVISPGGTNIPLVKAVQDDPFFKCFSVVDERSALYFAIGLYLQTGKPIAMSCTSAQATRNYIPGLTEAFYKKVPILAITMSKHPRFTYQEYMQAPDQTSLPADCVKKSFNLPFISDVNDVYHSIRVVNQAILELTQNGPGPVQLCVPWLDFPLLPIQPKIRKIKRYYIGDDFDFDFRNQRIMVIVGEHRKFEAIEIDELEKFAELNNVLIYVNHLSNCFCKFSLHANIGFATMSPNEFVKNYKPDIIISIGGQTGDYPLYNMLSRAEVDGIEHWRVNEDGEVVDTYDKLTKVFKMKEIDFFKLINKKNIDISVVKHEFFDKWKKLIDNMIYDVELPFSNMAIANRLSRQISSDSIIQFSILNSLRVWNLYTLKEGVECYSNVGAFGIDGGMSTLIGQSVVTDKMCIMVIGDLAFFYDMNSLGIRHIRNNLRILLVNNNGGIEFKLGNKDKKSIDRYIAGANHYKDAKGWAMTCGFKYMSAKTIEEFINIEKEFLSESEVPILLEAFVSDSDEAIAYSKIINVNKSQGIKTMIKKVIASTLGEDTVQTLKEKVQH